MRCWRPLPDSNCLEVSDDGVVRVIGGDELAQWVSGAGYLQVDVGGPAPLAVHRLVLEVFVGPAPPGHVAHHADHNKVNNRVGNLAWVTRSENGKRAWAAGRQSAVRPIRTTCHQGHPLDQTYRQRDRRGVQREWRRCSACRRLGDRRRREAAKHAGVLALPGL
jgi:hypothetical protein